MSIPDDLLDRARRLDPGAAEALLADRYPSVRRIALALVGDDAVARRVVAGVLERGLRVLPTWRHGAMPENWFYHHAVLSAREAAARHAPPSPADDPLVTLAPPAAGSPESPAPDPVSYAAFVRTVRGLPAQQAESYLLYHGERLNERLLGVAMDCSAVAAANHLRAATEALGAMTGTDLEGHTETLSRAYAALGPDPAAATIAVRAPVRRAVRAKWLRRLRRAFVGLLVLMFVVAIVYGAWHFRSNIRALLTGAGGRVAQAFLSVLWGQGE